MQKGLLLGLASAAVFMTACSVDRLTLPNENTATQDAASGAAGALQLQVTGIYRQLRGGIGGYVTALARFGREGYVYSPNEGRNTSHYLIGLPEEDRLDPSGFAVGVWAGPYGNLRDIYVTRKAVDLQTLLPPEQITAAHGALRTIEALELLYVIATRDSLGAVVDILEEPQDLAPFVSRDSVYNYILNTLDEAHAQLLAGGASFPFTLHSGFAGFNTPATYALFNRAIAARAAAYYATSGGGAPAWARAATALAASFYNPAATTAAAMNVGVYHVYSLSTGDAGNGLDSVATPDFLGHPSLLTDVQSNGPTRDLRYTAKVFTRTPPRSAPSGFGIDTDQGLRVYRNQSTPVPIIRNEELTLLDAEIRLATADKPGAIAALDRVRTNIGGLPASTLTGASSDADVLLGILYEKRYSLLAEGHRWVDMRRYGLLNTLPIDQTGGNTGHFIARVMPIPQAECLARVGKGAELAAPGC